MAAEVGTRNNGGGVFLSEDAELLAKSASKTPAPKVTTEIANSAE